MPYLKLTAISLFSGSMGLDLGFEHAGFDTRVACEMRKEACATIRLNRPKIPVLEGDITEFSTAQILQAARLKKGEATAIVGGPPCQAFSTAGRRNGFDEERGFVLHEYIRVIKEAQPKFFVFENVKGLTNAALKHISFYERVAKKDEDLEAEQRLGTAFQYILGLLRETGYKVTFRVLNAADYGTPQKRLRLIIFGSRDGISVGFPEPTHDDPKSIAVLSGLRKPWVTLRDALKGMKEGEQECAKLPSWGKYLKYVPPGGCWRDIPKGHQEEAMLDAFHSQGGRTGFYRRLKWDAPSPTLVTSPVFKGSCLAHPDHDRALSVQEYARIQGFPDDWKFVGSLTERYRMIGEAVPVQLARAVAEAVKKHAILLEIGQKYKTVPAR